MIELALEFGMLPHLLAARLPERELALLAAYARKWMLPTRRLQLQLARLCQITAGDDKAPLSAFLFDPPTQDDSDDATVADVGGREAAEMAARTIAGGRVFLLGQGRKQAGA